MISDFDHIPLVDMAPWRRRNPPPRLMTELRHICHEVGFFYVYNHGIDEKFCAHYLHIARRFFALPEAHKQQIHKQHSPHFRGWEQVGAELTNNQVDHREQIDLGEERPAAGAAGPPYMNLVGPNPWLEEHLIPGFRAAVMTFMGRMGRLARELTGMLSLSLKLERDHVQRVLGARPMPYIKLIRYPPTPAGGAGVGAHKDAGLLTILLQDDAGGLEAQNGRGEWIGVPPVAGALVVNLGEILQIMTGNYYVATPHRVFNQNAGRERLSATYFYNPDLNMRLGRLNLDPGFDVAAASSPHHQSAGLMASYADVKAGVDALQGRFDGQIYGDKYWQRWLRSYPDLVRKHYPQFAL